MRRCCNVGCDWWQASAEASSLLQQRNFLVLVIRLTPRQGVDRRQRNIEDLAIIVRLILAHDRGRRMAAGRCFLFHILHRLLEPCLVLFQEKGGCVVASG